jgi:hypothetical protein
LAFCFGFTVGLAFFDGAVESLFETLRFISAVLRASNKWGRISQERDNLNSGRYQCLSVLRTRDVNITFCTQLIQCNYNNNKKNLCSRAKRPLINSQLRSPQSKCTFNPQAIYSDRRFPGRNVNDALFI